MAQAPQSDQQAKEYDIPLSLIVVPANRLRRADPQTVENLRVSYRERGQVQAILVRPIDGEEGEQFYELVFGLHRLTAAQLEGWPTIRTRIRVLTDSEARALEIDENLIRADLTPLDFMVSVAERLELYAEQHPDQVVLDKSLPIKRRGRPPANFAKLAKIPGYVRSVMGFAEETAKDAKLSRRSVYYAIQTYAGLRSVADQLANTPIASNAAQLRQLAAVGDAKQQQRIVEALKDGRAKTFADAVAIAAGHQPAAKTATPTDETIKAFRKLWAAASPGARGLILGELQAKKLPAGWAVTGPEGGQ
ncbi:MAG TPA: ParB N-terminal domain-containing protein [Caulobacteraceae bacterium]|nr:ParB N-terminal domain-containing protein [Caulobacteraceae bacterium]